MVDKTLAIYLGACILAKDPDGKDNLYRRDSIARNAMTTAIRTAKILFELTEEELTQAEPLHPSSL